MAVKFSQFNVGTTISDIDYIVGYKSTNNVQIPIGLVVPSVDGSGTANYITKWTDADTIGDSIIYDDGTNVGIGGAPKSTVRLSTRGLTNTSADYAFEAANISGNSLFLVRSDGNVGIGTTIPTRQFTVNGTSSSVININSNASNGISILAFGDSDDDNYAQIVLDNSQNKLQIQNGGGGAISNRGITIDSSENVGIGTDSPSKMLDLSANNTGTAPASNVLRFTDIDSTASADQESGSIEFYTSDSSNPGVGSAIKGLSGPNGTASASLSFEVSGSERMHIASSGNVGIGTDSPAYKLDVNGIINIPYSGTNSNYFGTNFAFGYGRIYPFSGSGLFSFDANYASGSGGYQFNYNGTERMRITSAGNVGIGITVPTTSFNRVLHINDPANTSAELHITAGSSTTASDGLSIIQSGVTSFVYNREAGNMIFGTSNTERMRITSGGDVLIGGHTSVIGDAKLSSRSEDFDNRALELSTTYDGSSNKRMIEFYDGNNDSCGYDYINPSTNSLGRVSSSDYRLKEDEKDFDGLSIIKNTPVYDFKWKKSESRSYGVFAHELQQHYPEAVFGEKDGEENQGVDYAKLIPVLMKAIQQQQEEIETLKSQINN